jgi:hypothetical protein
MDADIIIKPMRGESLYSLVARLARINGYKPGIACKLLLGEELTPRVADATIDLPTFSKATNGIYGNQKEVLQRLTNLPFRSVIATPLLNAENSNKWERFISNAKMTLISVSNHEEHLWRCCPECINEDYKILGFTYWRTIHQLSGVYICTKHKISLTEISIPFRQRQSAFYLPDDFPKHISPRKKCPANSNYDIAIKLSLISEGIIGIPDQEVDQMSFRLTIKNGLKIKGLLTRGGSIQKGAYKVFKDYCNTLASIDEVRSLLQSRTLSKQIDALLVNFDISINKPVIIPLLILWLYDNWLLFKSNYEWECAMLSKNSLLNPPPSTKIQLSLEDHRKICVGFIQKNPSALRTDFWVSHPKSCRWLSHYDQEWFEENLTTLSPHQFNQMKLFR